MILIVDDFRDGAEALCRLLTLQGYPCRWVDGGPEALAAIRAHPREQPLLVVLDEMMPEMAGTDVLRALRSDPATAATPVIMLSAGFDVAKREQAISLGAVAWLMKGGGRAGDVTGMLRTISEWYERVGGIKSAPPTRKPTPKPDHPAG